MQIPSVVGVGRTQNMAPLTWDRPTPPPPAAPFDDASWTDDHEAVDFGEGAAPLITTATYDLRPKFTGRSAPMQQLQQLVDRAFAVGSLGVAVVVADPGMGKSRIMAELIARERAANPTLMVLSGVADEHVAADRPR